MALVPRDHAPTIVRVEKELLPEEVK